MKRISKSYDVVVVGGGISGVCAAISAARHGMHTALIQNRSVLGGNASSEIRVNINGAGRQGTGAKNLQETGIMREIFHRTKKINPQYSFNILDTTLWEMVHFQDNLDLFLNTHFYDATTVDGKIQSIRAMQYTSETEFTFSGKMFVDTTGDAALAYESGALWTIGREAKATYNEDHAPEVADKHTMGSTVMFTTKDMGEPTPFKKPEWAYTFTKEKLGNRKVGELNHGYWWVELGGDDLSVIEDSEQIRDELYKWAFGVFDYIKNCGEYDADNLVLDWICSVPGRRESRRTIGDYVLCESDCYEGRRFEDAIAYGGWTMDDHTVGGIKAMGNNEEGTQWLPIKDIYTIPYRSIYSKNIDNLYIGGRALSVSHMAMSSTRVIATCGVIGEAIGVASSMAVSKGISPREVGVNHIHELQQTLIKDDCFLPGIKTDDVEEICANTACKFSASSFVEGGEPEKIANGDARDIGDATNAWVSTAMSENPEWIQVALANPTKLNEIHLKFDCNLTKTLHTTLVPKRIKSQPADMPYELVKSFVVEFLSGDEVVETITETENIYRFCKYNVTTEQEITDVKVTVKETYGDKQARIFEVRLY